MNRLRWLTFLGVLAFVGSGCGSAITTTNAVFEVSLDSFTPEGCLIIALKPNGQPRPKGEGPYGDYFLVLRSPSNKP